MTKNLRDSEVDQGEEFPFEEEIPAEGEAEAEYDPFGAAPDLNYDPFAEARLFAFGNLDDAQEAVTVCLENERGSQWKLGAVVASAVEEFGRYGTYKALAGVAFYTTRRLKTFEQLHRTFPARVRYPDQPLLLYEIALETNDPVAVLEEAVQEGWSPRQLKDSLSEGKGKDTSEVKLFEGRAPIIVKGSTWRIAVEAGRDWPEGDGAYTCQVTVRQVLQSSV